MQVAVPIVVKAEQVSFRYEHGLALEKISFSVEEGDLLGIVGPNGAGKTTLFNCLLGSIEGYQGRITVFDKDIRKDRKMLKRIGYVPQKLAIDRGFPATVEEIVSLGIDARRPPKNKIISAMDTVGLISEKDRRIGELSGGQQQRVLIAKALVNDPAVIILDEPTTGIDLETQNKFYLLIKKLNLERKITIILASHDLDAIGKLANKVACINRSMIFHGDAREFFENEHLLKKYSESSMQAHMHQHPTR